MSELNANKPINPFCPFCGRSDWHDWSFPHPRTMKSEAEEEMNRRAPEAGQSDKPEVEVTIRLKRDPESGELLADDDPKPEAGQEPVAWMHTMDNTEGIEGNKPHVVVTQSDEHPFGRPGKDYSESFPVTSIPLYAQPQRPAVPDDDAILFVANRTMYAENTIGRPPRYIASREELINFVRSLLTAAPAPERPEK